MVTGTEHIGLIAKDSVFLKDWYIRVFGFKLILENNTTFFIMAPDRSMLELIQADENSEPLGPKVSGIRHLAFTIDNFEKTVETLRAEKVEELSEPKVSPDGTKIFFFRDPEGNIMQLIDRPKPLGW